MSKKSPVCPRKRTLFRFKKGQSGNPNGRPRKQNSNIQQVHQALFKSVRVKDAGGYRSVPKIVAAIEVLLNKALTGDVRAFLGVLKIVEKYKLMSELPMTPRIVAIRRIIVDPKQSTPDTRPESTT